MFVETVLLKCVHVDKGGVAAHSCAIVGREVRVHVSSVTSQLFDGVDPILTDRTREAIAVFLK